MAVASILVVLALGSVSATRYNTTCVKEVWRRSCCGVAACEADISICVPHTGKGAQESGNGIGAGQDGTVQRPWPTILPTFQPTTWPTDVPVTKTPTLEPSLPPTMWSTYLPTRSPTATPTFRPTTLHPTFEPTHHPTATPTFGPTLNPTFDPTYHPTATPTLHPTAYCDMCSRICACAQA